MNKKIFQIFTIFLIIIFIDSFRVVSNNESVLILNNLKEGNHFLVTSQIPTKYELTFGSIGTENSDKSPFGNFTTHKIIGTNYSGNLTQYSHYNVSITKIAKVTNTTNPYYDSIFGGNQTLISVKQELKDINNKNSNPQTIYSQSTLNGWWDITQQLIKTSNRRINQFQFLINFNDTSDLNSFINQVLNIYLQDNSTSKVILNNYGFPYFTDFSQDYAKQLKNETLQSFHKIYDTNNGIIIFGDNSNFMDFDTGLAMNQQIRVENYSVEFYLMFGSQAKINNTCSCLNDLNIFYQSIITFTNLINPNEAKFYFSDKINMNFRNGIYNFLDFKFFATSTNKSSSDFPINLVAFTILAILIAKRKQQFKR